MQVDTHHKNLTLQYPDSTETVTESDYDHMLTNGYLIDLGWQPVADGNTPDAVMEDAFTDKQVCLLCCCQCQLNGDALVLHNWYSVLHKTDTIACQASHGSPVTSPDLRQRDSILQDATEST